MVGAPGGAEGRGLLGHPQEGGHGRGYLLGMVRLSVGWGVVWCMRGLGVTDLTEWALDALFFRGFRLILNLSWPKMFL